MSRVLIATWDGAGNLVPTLAIARRLSARGHDVRLLGHASIDARCGAHGWRFRAYSRAVDCDSLHPREHQRDMTVLARELWLADAVADDVREELVRERADVLIADCMLAGALSAGQAVGVPTIALFHGAFALFRRGPLAEMMSSGLGSLNEWRCHADLARVASIANIHDACALSLVATPREFEPELPLPANVRFVGPLLDSIPLTGGVDELPVDTHAEPLIVVSFSTSEQGQRPVLQRIVSALEQAPARAIVTAGPAVDPASLEVPPNVDVVRFVPHQRLLPRAALVITHAGLGTVMAALTHGVPMLCMPLGRDQFFNAARVEAIGAGRTIAADTSVDAIADAVRELLQDAGTRHAARQFAGVIRHYVDRDDAPLEIERLAVSPAAHATIG